MSRDPATGTPQPQEASVNSSTLEIHSRQTEDDWPSPFEELNLNPQLIAAIERSGYTTPTPIQAETIPHVLDGTDLIAQAETGSGKTAAFACPLLSNLDLNHCSPQVLVLTPTRELAIQVTESFKKYGECSPGFRATCIYGGQSYNTQLSALRRGVHVVVGTPGRVMDHLRQGTLDLSNLKTFVLDEADEMLRMGFIDDVEWILEQLPKQRQILLFSATMPDPIKRIAQTHLTKPITVSIKSETATAAAIEQSFLFVSPREKVEQLSQLLSSEVTDGVIVFVKTRNTTVQVADQLTRRGLSAAPLNGEIPQNQRERTIDQLKSGRLDVLVATDVAARGLDVQRISHVINFDFPHDNEAYIHRIGRTGRAGRTGSAILFVEPREKGKLNRLQRATNQRMDTFRQKSLAEINEQRVAQFKQRISDHLASTDQHQLFETIISDYQCESGAPIEQIAAALAVMAQGETPLLLNKRVESPSNWKRDSKNGKDSGPMTTYRVEVGRSHGVRPGNLVGAITNEANVDNSSIGRIKLFDSFSTIDLADHVDRGTIDRLEHVVVSGRQLRISLDQSPSRDRNSKYNRKKKRNDGSTRFGKRKSKNSPVKVHSAKPAPAPTRKSEKSPTSKTKSKKSTRKFIQIRGSK